MTDAIDMLQAGKEQADRLAADRRIFRTYIDAMREFGWTDEDVAEYSKEVERIMKSGTEQEIEDARRFWAEKCDLYSANGINNRIRRSINESKRKAA